MNPKKTDYKKVKHWEKETWVNLRHRKGEPPSGDTTTEPVHVQYWEYPNGNVVPRGRRLRICNEVRSMLTDLRDKGIEITTIKNMGWEVRQDYRNRMETLYPWLRLCADQWKADQVWDSAIGSWSPSPKGKMKELENLKREHPIEESEPGPSSKKLKAVDVEHPKTPVRMKPNRPKPTKKPAAMVISSLRVYSIT